MPSNPQPILLLTRPEPASRRFAAEFDLPGVMLVISPVLRIIPVAHDAARLSAARGLVFTSVNAVPAAGPGRGRPAICVGPATAEAAQAAGYEVTVGPGDAERMMPLLKGLDDGWLHPHGTHVARRLPVPGMVVYDQAPERLNAEAKEVLAGSAPVLLPLFSPRSARLLSPQAEDAQAPLWLAPISAAARGAWLGPASRIELAPTPDADGICHALSRLLATEQSARGRVEAPRPGD